MTIGDRIGYIDSQISSIEAFINKAVAHINANNLTVAQGEAIYGAIERKRDNIADLLKQRVELENRLLNNSSPHK